MSLTDIVVPEALVGSFHQEGQLRVNIYRTEGAVVRVEAISLTEDVQTHFFLSRENALELSDILKQAAEPTT